MSDPNPRAQASPSALEQRFGQGVTFHQGGQFAEAERAYQGIISIEPNQADTLHMLGILHIQTGRLDSGFGLIDRALAIRPDFFEAHENRGLALLQLGRLAEALASFDKALAIRPGAVAASFNRGVLLTQLGRPADALASFDAVLGVQPDYAEAAVNRGLVLASLKRPLDALASFDRALAIRPDYADALLNRGVALNELKRFEESLASIDKALALRPDDAKSWFNRGGALKELKRPGEALVSFDKALSIQPSYVEALINRGVMLKTLGRTDEALAQYAKALAISPNNVEALTCRGVALNDLLRLDEALASYDAALAIAPDNALATFNKSLILLLTGRFEAGWPLYESRKNLADARTFAQFRTFPGPPWDGQTPLSAKRLFVYWEQGLGDTIQFCRYASMAADRGARVVLSVQDELLSLLKDFDPRVELMGGDRAPLAYDYHAALLSLPGAFGTTVQTIPTATADLRADANKIAAWSARLGPPARPRIGLVWSGGLAHENDRNRSISFGLISPLLSADAEWICLQKDIRGSDLPALAGRPQLKMFAPDLIDFSDTAALIANLDLVISVDTSVAHLAAAMGKPTWILLPFTPDWRWLLDRDDSPWHPSARLFRQSAPGDWGPAIERVRGALTAHLLQAAPL